MNQKDDYISGPHNYWFQFVCGFLFGAFLGGWLCRWLFSGPVPMVIGAAAGGVCLGLCCGRWGDRVWKAIFESPWWRV